MGRGLRTIACAVAMSVAASGMAQAAFIEGIVGQVQVDFGQGFVPVTTPAALKAGDRIMVGPNSKAQIQYPGGCYTDVLAGRVVVVRGENTCALAHEQAHQTPTGDTHGGWGTGAAIGGAAVLGGAAILIASSKKSASP